MELAIAEDGRVFVVERGGAILMWDPETNGHKRVGYIPVYMMIEDGLLGLALDPHFKGNGWLYVFYAPADGGASRLSRFTFDGKEVQASSEKILLEVPMQREVCCHAAGSIAFGPDGALYVSVGDNTDHIDTAGGPIDERPGHVNEDGQFTAANTNDLRGKILRIKPEPDGTYSIPEDNLFEGDELHRGEIYIMGLRNAFRISVDQETGWLYFADVGSGDPPNERGDWGWDEFNQARGPGNYGWPYLTGNNSPYRDYNYDTGEIGDPFNPVALVNDSPNNTGAQVLPPAQPAMIWYTFGESDLFPELGAGGVNPMSGPVYRRVSTHGEYALPNYYLGKHFIYDWMRNWMNVVTLDENGNYESIEPFLRDMEFARPMDMEVGPDGALYIIEWGKGFWGSNEDAQVVRVIYHGEDEAPVPPSPVQETHSGIAFNEPENGSFFEYDQPIRYEAVVEGLNDPVSGIDSVQVRSYSGFDTNQFLIDHFSEVEGEFVITRAYTHIPDLHFRDRYAMIEACAWRGGEEQCNAYKLHPFKKEAEHTERPENASRKTYGISPAERAFPETALTVMQMKHDSKVYYPALHIEDVSSAMVRYKPLEKGTLSFSLYQSPADRTEFASLDLGAPIGRKLPTLPQSAVLDQLEANGQGHLLRVASRPAYNGWYEVQIDLPEGVAAGTLLLEAYGVSDDVLVEVDWIEFVR